MRMITVAQLKFVVGLARQAIPQLWKKGTIITGSGYSLHEATKEVMAAPITGADMAFMRNMPLYHQIVTDNRSLIDNQICALLAFFHGVYAFYCVHYVQAIFLTYVIYEILKKFGFFRMLTKKFNIFKKYLLKEWANHQL